MGPPTVAHVQLVALRFRVAVSCSVWRLGSYTPRSVLIFLLCLYVARVLVHMKNFCTGMSEVEQH